MSFLTGSASNEQTCQSKPCTSSTPHSCLPTKRHNESSCGCTTIWIRQSNRRCSGSKGSRRLAATLFKPVIEKVLQLLQRAVTMEYFPFTKNAQPSSVCMNMITSTRGNEGRWFLHGQHLNCHFNNTLVLIAGVGGSLLRSDSIFLLRCPKQGGR